MTSVWNTVVQHPLKISCSIVLYLLLTHFAFGFSNDFVLVSAGIIFLLVADMVLCLGLKMSIILTTHKCFNCCLAMLTLNEGFFSFSHFPAGKKMGVYQTRTADPHWPRRCPGPYSVMLNNTTGGVGGGDGCISGTDWSLVSELWAIALCITHFVYYYFPVPFLLKCLYLSDLNPWIYC